MSQTTRTAVITGASAGIGEATAIRLASEGYSLVLGARRVEKLEAVAEKTGALALQLDVTNDESVATFAAQVERCDVLVNNAGLASGLQPVESLDLSRVETMWNTNVMGLLRVTQALMPKLKDSTGHIVNLASTAGFEVYPGGGGYTASKHAVRVLTRTLRIELLGTGIRVTEIAPGLVETEFSIVRFDGDKDMAKKPYEGLKPLSGDDIADCIAWAISRPPHVNIDELVIRPVSQATSRDIHRE